MSRSRPIIEYIFECWVSVCKIRQDTKYSCLFDIILHRISFLYVCFQFKCTQLINVIFWHFNFRIQVILPTQHGLYARDVRFHGDILNTVIMHVYCVFWLTWENVWMACPLYERFSMDSPPKRSGLIFLREILQIKLGNEGNVSGCIPVMQIQQLPIGAESWIKTVIYNSGCIWNR